MSPRMESCYYSFFAFLLVRKDQVMAEFKMLDELIHYCTRCKLDLNHRVIRVDNGVPKRVLCLTCQSERVYKPKGIAARKTAAGRAAATREALESKWREKLHAGNKTPKPYSMEDTYKVDDILSHKSFGLGLSTELVPPDKMLIFFDEGMKLLKCGKIH